MSDIPDANVRLVHTPPNQDPNNPVGPYVPPTWADFPEKVIKRLLRDGLKEEQMKANLQILYNICEFMMPQDVRYRY